MVTKRRRSHGKSDGGYGRFTTFRSVCPQGGRTSWLENDPGRANRSEQGSDPRHHARGMSRARQKSARGPHGRGRTVRPEGSPDSHERPSQGDQAELTDFRQYLKDRGHRGLGLFSYLTFRIFFRSLTDFGVISMYSSPDIISIDFSISSLYTAAR